MRRHRDQRCRQDREAELLLRLLAAGRQPGRSSRRHPIPKTSAGAPSTPSWAALWRNRRGTGISGEHVSAGQTCSRRASWTVGRILCARLRGPAVIHLGLPLPTASCGPPADSGGLPSNVRAGLALPGHLDLAPGGVYRAAAVTCGAGGLLHHRFTLTANLDARPETGGGLFSVALSRGSPRVGVTDHPALGVRTFLGDPGIPEPTRPPVQLARRLVQSLYRPRPHLPPRRLRPPAANHVVWAPGLRETHPYDRIR